MNDKTLLSEIIWEVSLLGCTYRFQVPQRAKAVTLALNAYQEENPNTDISLSVLRTKVRTRFISLEDLLLEKAFND